MIDFEYSKKFKKGYKRLDNKTKLKVGERLKVLSFNKFDQVLNNHKLHGEYGGYFSINITADIRVVCKQISGDKYLLFDIGTHSDLYE